VTTPPTVGELCAELRRLAAEPGRVDLWVPGALTAGANPSGIAMAVIADTALSLGLWPDGFTPGDGGRTYHYTR
jgi:hypothetical protein